MNNYDGKFGLIDNDDKCNFILNKQSMVKRFTFNYIMNLFKKGNS